MGPTRRKWQWEQPELFDEPRIRPSWSDLSPTVRDEVTKLLEALLNGVAQADRPAVVDTEAGHE